MVKDILPTWMLPAITRLSTDPVHQSTFLVRGGIHLVVVQLCALGRGVGVITRWHMPRSILGLVKFHEEATLSMQWGSWSEEDRQ